MVAALELGMNGYIIGRKLTPEQKEITAGSMVSDAYEGTFKFKDGDLFIVTAGNDDTVLALYQRNEEANMDQARRMVSGLMGLYGEPTTMAHDKLIYWAYTGEGKISEETYNTIKENNETIAILATVKFNSTFAITGEIPPDQEETGINYFIISSDPLTREFMSQKNELLSELFMRT